MNVIRIGGKIGLLQMTRQITGRPPPFQFLFPSSLGVGEENTLRLNKEYWELGKN
jgi:hypothetical protein